MMDQGVVERTKIHLRGDGTGTRLSLSLSLMVIIFKVVFVGWVSSVKSEINRIVQ